MSVFGGMLPRCAAQGVIIVIAVGGSGVGCHAVFPEAEVRVNVIPFCTCKFYESNASGSNVFCFVPFASQC